VSMGALDSSDAAATLHRMKRWGGMRKESVIYIAFLAVDLASDAPELAYHLGNPDAFVGEELDFEVVARLVALEGCGPERCGEFVACGGLWHCGDASGRGARIEEWRRMRRERSKGCL
jgi:hypothetical protein